MLFYRNIAIGGRHDNLNYVNLIVSIRSYFQKYLLNTNIVHTVDVTSHCYIVISTIPRNNKLSGSWSFA